MLLAELCDSISEEAFTGLEGDWKGDMRRRWNQSHSCRNATMKTNMMIARESGAERAQNFCCVQGVLRMSSTFMPVCVSGYRWMDGRKGGGYRGTVDG